jgi:hypothetical protein
MLLMAPALPRFGNKRSRARRVWDSVGDSMTGKLPRDDAADVRGVLAELEELVGDLGLEAPPAPHRAALPPPVKRPRAKKITAAGESEPEHALAQDDAAELTALAAAVAGVGPEPGEVVPLWEVTDAFPPDERAPQEDVTLWDAFAPELDATPPRPWSTVAAMEVVEPAAPPRPNAEPRARGIRRLAGAVRPRLFTAATIAAVLIAVVVVVLTRLDFGHTAGPATPVAKAAFQVTLMRTVDATAATSVPFAKTTSNFPPKTTQVFMDVVYRNAAAGDTLRLVISVLPPAGSGGNPTLVGDQTHQLPAGGEIAVTIQGPATGFAPGAYTVTAFHDGHLEQSVNFTVDATAGEPASTPTPTAAAPAPAAPVAPTP